MRNSKSGNRIATFFLLLLLLNIGSGCRYYKVSSSKQPDANLVKRSLEKYTEENKNILIYHHEKYYSLFNLKYNQDSTILTASCKIDSSKHLYNPYFHFTKKYRSRKGEQSVLNEVFIISDSLAISGDSVTMRVASISGIDCIRNNPARGAGNVSLVILGLAGVGVIILGAMFGFHGGGGYI